MKFAETKKNVTNSIPAKVKGRILNYLAFICSLQIEYDDRAKQPLKQQQQQHQKQSIKKPIEDEYEGEDFDIDAI